MTKQDKDIWRELDELYYKRFVLKGQEEALQESEELGDYDLSQYEDDGEGVNDGIEEVFSNRKE